jgi:hypothetical protein
MGISQSLRHGPILVERFVTLPATSGTAVGPAVGAGTLVLAAGLEVLQTVPDITTYTVNITDGTTTFGSALNIDNVPAGTIRAGVTPGFIAAADTIDAVSTISGSPGTIRARIWALITDVNDGNRPAEAADRDVLA